MQPKWLQANLGMRHDVGISMFNCFQIQVTIAAITYLSLQDAELVQIV